MLERFSNLPDGNGGAPILRTKPGPSGNLAAIGAASVGIVHDINNMLTAMSGNIELALADLDNRPVDLAATRKRLKAIQQCTRTITEICRRIQRFGNIKDDVVSANLRQMVEDSVALSRNLLNSRWKDKKIVITTSAVPADIYCRAIAPEVHMCLLNIVLNAIRHGFYDRDEGVISFVGSSAGGVVQLDISNDGAPVPPEIREELLKMPVSSFCDNGYGMYTALESIRKFGGDITFSSTAEKTTFSVWLQAAEPPLAV